MVATSAFGVMAKVLVVATPVIVTVEEEEQVLAATAVVPTVNVAFEMPADAAGVLHRGRMFVLSGEESAQF
jgi:hypothetical protein